ncbi:MAG: GNAT family N-acetyltransferase [Flavobacteriales bacterium]|nr:GNAT family N-acetyltransferase [Flavobacteriales bacterium]
MEDLILVKHAAGAPGLRMLGLGPNLLPHRGIDKLKSLLEENSSWSKNRKKKDLKIMLSRSLVIVSAWTESKLIGFGRATSDEIYRTVLWDIVVDGEYRKNGVGKRIILTILNNKYISKTEKIYLMTTNCERFYSKMGFELEKSQNLMILDKNSID